MVESVSGNGGIELVNHSMAQMLSMAVNARKHDRDLIFRMSRCLITTRSRPLPAFLRTSCIADATLACSSRCLSDTFDGHQGLDQGQIPHHDLARPRQRKPYTLMREQHAINPSRLERSATALCSSMHRLPGLVIEFRCTTICRSSAEAPTEPPTNQSKKLNRPSTGWNHLRSYGRAHTIVIGWKSCRRHISLLS